MIIAITIVIILVVIAGIYFYKPAEDISARLEEYLNQTAHLSLSDGMRRVPAFAKIVAVGKEKAVPPIIDEIRKTGGQMALYVLLWELTGIRPNHPMIDGVVKYDIKAEEKAWLQWAKQKGI